MFRLNLVALALTLSACVSFIPNSKLPDTYVYETSVRGEQGWIGAGTRKKSAAALLSGGVVIDPTETLQAALPNADVKMRRWGLVYSSKIWERYHVVLDADVSQKGQRKVKCRLISPQEVTGAPTLTELLAHDGADVQRRLTGLVKTCVQAKKLAGFVG